MNYIVICRDDKDGSQKGRYVLATRTVFPDKAAARIFAGQISSSRQARLVEGPWDTLTSSLGFGAGFVAIGRGRRAGRQKGYYALAAPQIFQNRRQALLVASGLPSRAEPLAIFGNWDELRFQAVEFFVAT